MEFMGLRIPTGDVNRKCFNLHNAVNITDNFMKAVINGSKYELVDPKRGGTGEFLDARTVWVKLLETRFRTGEPYLNFIDTANANLPEPLKELGLKINGSNLCNEIHLPTNEERTAVCCLSSVNLEFYDEWKNTSMIQDLVVMLDNVLEYFIENAPSVLARAKYSAMRSRDIGLGAMGFHEYLQYKGIAFESDKARLLNKDIFQTIKSKAKSMSMELGMTRGSAPDLGNNNARHSRLLAIAPNASSGILLSTSPSIEPSKANAYTHRTRAGSFLVKNKYLEKMLEALNKNTDEVWQSIITNKGSVQHFKWLSEETKAVFKTSFELDQMWVVKHAADRQPFICQGQSVNLFFPAGADRAYVNKVHIEAWKLGLKGLYYLRTEANNEQKTYRKRLRKIN